jgi:hypothetical protein
VLNEDLSWDVIKFSLFSKLSNFFPVFLRVKSHRFSTEFPRAFDTSLLFKTV